MKKGMILWVVTGAVVGLWAGGMGAEPLRDYLQEGRAAYDRGDYPLAVDRLTEAVVRFPTDKRAQRLLVAAGQKMVDKQALDQISLDDLRRMVSDANAVLEKRQKEIRRVLNELKIAQRASDKLTPEETLRACRGVDLLLEVTLGDDPESQQFRAYLRSVCANLKTALDRGILVRPEDEKRVFGYVAFCRSDWAAAAASWEEALKRQPKDLHLRELWTAAKAKEAQHRAEAKTAHVLSAAEAAMAAHEDEEALRLLREAMKEMPGEERLVALYEDTQERISNQSRQQQMADHRRKALANQKAGHWLEAAQQWLAMLNIDPLNVEARENLDQLRRHLSAPLPQGGATPTAEAEKRSEKFYTIGLIRYADGDLDNAAAEFKNALEVNPSHEYARKALERVEEERRPFP